MTLANNDENTGLNSEKNLISKISVIRMLVNVKAKTMETVTAIAVPNTPQSEDRG